MSAIVFERPDLPVITLQHGPWRVEMFDPRADTTVLGARYVHGGYMAEVRRGERVISGAATPAWNTYNGIGFPESFPESLGLAVADEGEEFLRIGAGRTRKSGRGNIQVQNPLTRLAQWKVTDTGPAHAVFETQDEMTISGVLFGYQLRRTVRLLDNGLVSRTELTVRNAWDQTLNWYPHPFYVNTRSDRTAFRLPESPVRHLGGDLKLSPDGLLRLGPKGGFGPVTGMWGNRDSIDVFLDSTQGGGGFRMVTDYPADKIMVWGNEYVVSIEPFWTRSWHDGERAAWEIAYHWHD